MPLFARARTDDDEIVIAPVVHANSSQRGANPYALCGSRGVDLRHGRAGIFFGAKRFFG
jgi:hypothetical protein